MKNTLTSSLSGEKPGTLDVFQGNKNNRQLDDDKFGQ